MLWAGSRLGQRDGPPRDAVGAGLIALAQRAATTIKTIFQDAATSAGDSWKKSFRDGVSSYISGKLSEAQKLSARVDGRPGRANPFAAGGNGPFENIYGPPMWLHMETRVNGGQTGDLTRKRQADRGRFS